MTTEWTMRIVRLGIHKKGTRRRTYGTYEVLHDGVKVEALSGHTCERIGPGDTVNMSGHRIPEGSYEMWTQFGKYKTAGYWPDPSPAGKQPMPALGLREPGNPHGVGDRTGQCALLLLRSPGPHLYGHNRHAVTS